LNLRFNLSFWVGKEPGYYEAESFGIRLETDLEVIRAKTEYSTKPILKFNALTLVPFERKLIDECALTVEQVVQKISI
jgi:Xaa-Pro aminopeptidase